MSSDVPRIQRLDETVVNRIAAGEVIQRPANVLKELLENSLDAKSSSISILVKDGGLKLLQIQDNGCGIARADLPILCERFTTSKLRKYQDLSTIATFGFRGEALASISHVAHLTVTTKTANSPCAYRAIYLDGKLVPPKPGQPAEPKPCAGNNGTQITVEDLFFNVPTRRKALHNTTEEYNKILDVCQKYAIHYSKQAGFTCRKQGSNTADVNTSATASVVDNIRTIYGNAIARELLSTSLESDVYSFKMTAYFTNPNYNTKKMVFLLFINHRLVNCNSLKSALSAVYSAYLLKGTHPFIYVSLEIDPRHVDVNVHPTKQEVHFLNEEEIVGSVCEAVEARLQSAGESRNFTVQTLITENFTTAPTSSLSRTGSQPTADRPQTASEDISPPASTSVTGNISATKKYEPHKLVRVSGRTQTLDMFWNQKDRSSSFGDTPGVESPVVTERSGVEVPKRVRVDEDNADGESQEEDEQPMSVDEDDVLELTGQKVYTEVRLTSIFELRASVQKDAHDGLTAVFRDHTFVGLVTPYLALIQHQTKLYLVNVVQISQTLFYQLALKAFSNFGPAMLTQGVSLMELLLMALDEQEEINGGWDERLMGKEDIAVAITTLLVERREMLEEYFSVIISESGDLLALPYVLKGYTPNLDKLPLFLLRLGTEVNWEEEKPCFDDFCRELANFYALEPPDSGEDVSPDDSNASTTQEKDEYAFQVHHVVFHALKNHFLAPQYLVDSGDVLQVGELSELYKVFERC